MPGAETPQSPDINRQKPQQIIKQGVPKQIIQGSQTPVQQQPQQVQHLQQQPQPQTPQQPPTPQPQIAPQQVNFIFFKISMNCPGEFFFF